MKKLFTIAVLLIASTFLAQAQVQQEEIDYYQSIFGMEKKVMVASFLELDESAPFWSVYDEYEEARKQLGERRLKLLAEYAEKYDHLTDDDISGMVKDLMTIRKDAEALMAKYYKKIEKVSGTKTAAQFYQIECYFITAISAEFYSTVPLIGEFE